MSIRGFLYSLAVISVIYILSVSGAGCAQIGAPTGGAKDTIAPHLIKASPAENAVNFTGNKITLSFDEYVEIQDAYNNVLVSPLPKNQPFVDWKLKTVTVKLKDTLQPNTTYSINFGSAIKDANEGNPLKDFTYIFSTGSTIDSLILTGKILLAETGKTDSTLFALLYRKADDSAVQKRKPDYMARVNSDGTFTFKNLPADNYKVYALKDGDGSKTYNSKIEMFAFADKDVATAAAITPVTLYAYEAEKDNKAATTSAAADKKLRYTSPVTSEKQDLNTGLELAFNKPLKTVDTSRIILTDTNYKPITASFSFDKKQKNILLTTKWKEDEYYRLIVMKEAVSDSANNSLAKTDTLFFSTKKESEYGNVVMRFNKIDLSRHPILQFVQAETIKESFSITSKEWNKKLFPPGEYDLRILYDENNNGKWDPGDYSKKIQPEKVIAITQKVAIRPNWDNEKEIQL